MSSKSAAKRLARAVQDEVVHRRGGEPPSYMACLTQVQRALAEPRQSERPDERDARIVMEVAGRMR